MQLHARAIRLLGMSGQRLLIESPLPEGMIKNFGFLGFQERENLQDFLMKNTYSQFL